MAVVSAVPSSRPAAPSGSVQSVARAAAVLRCFLAPPASFSLTDLSRQTGLSVSTTYRLARTLCAESLLYFDARTEKYRPGTMLMGLGRAAIASSGLDQARQILDNLSEVTGESAAVNIRQDRLCLSVLTASSTQGLRVVDELGVSSPLHLTAAGKALLAFGEEPIEAAVRAMGRLERPTRWTLSTQAKLARDLRRSVVRGFTFCDEEREEGVRAIGAPILDDRGVARAAIGIQGPVFRLADERVPELAEQVRGAASQCASVLQFGRGSGATS